MILVNLLFDGKGYAGWSRAIVIALSAKNKIGFIDGSSAEPASDSTHHKAWNRCNDMIISWILNSFSKDIAESVLYLKTLITALANAPVLQRLRPSSSIRIGG